MEMKKHNNVLILVVMEYGLRPHFSNRGRKVRTVLILVVMEYGLRLLRNRYNVTPGLNPCCNGIWSQTTAEADVIKEYVVLILVVMEYGLRRSYWAWGGINLS